MKTTFLVVIDSSEAAYYLTHWAALLAAVADGRLVLVPVETPLVPAAPLQGLENIPPEYYAQQEQTLAQAAEELTEVLTVPVAVERLVANLHEVLDELIARWHPQLLVLPLAAEHSLLDHLLLNQALPALRDAGLPLLLVPAEAALAPLLPRQVAIAAGPEAFRLTGAARALRPLLASWEAEYCLVHVAAPEDTAAAGPSQAEAAVRASGLLPVGTPCRTHRVRHEARSAGIVQAALEVEADIVVLAARPRSLAASVFGRGVAAHVARTCPVPLLLLPTLAEPAAAPRRPRRKSGTRAGRAVLPPTPRPTAPSKVAAP